MNSFIFGTLRMPLLQRGLLGFKEDNPEEVIILIIGIGVLIAIGIIVYIIRRAIHPGRGPTTNSPKYGFFSFRQLAASYGLDKDQRRSRTGTKKPRAFGQAL